jgi:hypothetical protein
LRESRGCASFKAFKGEAVVAYRALGNEEDGVTSAFPPCWVVAESDLSVRSLKPKGQTKWDLINGYLQLTMRKVTKLQQYLYIA